MVINKKDFDKKNIEFYKIHKEINKKNMEPSILSPATYTEIKHNYKTIRTQLQPNLQPNL